MAGISYIEPDEMATAQSKKSRGSLALGIKGRPSGENLDGNRTKKAKTDMVSPQQFATHPRIEEEISEASVGAQNWPSAPGRPPTSSFDGPSPGVA